MNTESRGTEYDVPSPDPEKTNSSTKKVLYFLCLLLLANLEEKPERESPKRTISASGGLELLLMVLQPNIGRCANEEAKLQRGWTRGGVPGRTLGPKGGWIGSPTSIGEGNECQRGRWTPKRGGL